MNNNDEQWWEAQCAEYVLGTLRGAERDVLEKILLADDEVRNRVIFWENTLSAFLSHIQPVQPPEDVLPGLLSKIGRPASPPPTDNQTLSDQDSTQDNVADDLTGTWTEDIESVLAADYKTKQENSKTHHQDVKQQAVQEDIPELAIKESSVDSIVETNKSAEQPEQLLPEQLAQQPQPPLPTVQTHSRVWKPLALLATAASVLLAGLFLKQNMQTPNPWPIPDTGNLSVVHDEDQQALWLVTKSGNSDQATVVALAPPSLEPQQSHHLWIVQTQDQTVASVGLMPRMSGQSRVMSLPVPISQATLFAVSLEPAAGSPEAVPTGPILFKGAIQPLGGSIQ